MPIQAGKIYNDGSHFIVIKPTTRPKKEKVKKPEVMVEVVDEDIILPNDDAIDGQDESDVKIEDSCPEIDSSEEEHKDNEKGRKKGKEMSLKEIFNQLYEESTKYKKAERKPKIVRAMRRFFRTERDCELFVDSNMERVQRNLTCRRVRVSRKVNLNPFNYFVTFTYNNELHTEDSFYKKLKKFFKNMCHRYNWQYIGVWERSSKTKRLHFHGLFVIPDGTIPGNLEIKKDYNTNTHKMQEVVQSDVIEKKFGRNDFRELNPDYTSNQALAYILKYLEKSETELVSSRNISQYIVSDILDDDIICNYGDNENKFVLYDKFLCIDDGTIIGQVSPDVIKQMPKAN